MTGIAAILHMEIPGLDDMLEGEEDEGDIESGDDDSEFIVGALEEDKSETQSEKGDIDADHEAKAREFFGGSDQASGDYENDLLDDIFGEMEQSDSEEL